MNRIGANFNRAELNNLKKAESKEDLIKESKGKTLIESATVKLVDGNIVVDRSDKGGIIAPPEHKDINPNIDNIVNGNNEPKTVTEEVLHDDGSKTVTTTTKDNKGNIISERREDYDANGILRFVYDMQTNGDSQTIKRLNYDENGVLRKESTTNFGPDGSSIYDLEYDKNGNCTSQYTENRDIDGKTLSVVEVNDEYDDNGNKTNRHIVQYNGKGTIVADFNIKYENGVTTGERLFYDETSGRLKQSIVEVTKENGEKSVKTTNYNEDGSYTEVEESFNANGNLVRKKETVEDADGNITITTTTYNEDGSVKNTRTVHLKKRTADAMAEPREMHSRFE